MHQTVEEKLTEMEFSVKTLPLSFSAHAPAPPPLHVPQEDRHDVEHRESSKEEEQVAAKAERAVTLEAKQKSVEQQSAYSATSEQLRTVVAELFRLNSAVGEVKQQCDQLQKISSQPVTAVKVTASPRTTPSPRSEGTEKPPTPHAARPSVSRPRTSSTLTAHRTYSTSLATEAARQATEEVIESSRLRSMRTEMAGLKEEMDKIRAVAMSSIYMAQQSAKNRPV